MELQEFIKERERMLNALGRKYGICNGVNCGECTLAGICSMQTQEEAQRCEEIVKKWSAEHQIETNLQHANKLIEEAFGVCNHFHCTACKPGKRDVYCNNDCDYCEDWWNEAYKPPVIKP